MLARLDSRSLSQFLAVAEALSFRQAADTLHMSQPPLSRAIRELEERLGVRLFDRHSQGASLTDAGRKLLPFAQKEARLLKEAEAALAGVRPPVRLRLGLTNAVEPAWFDGLVDRIRACLPDASVSATSDSSPRLVRQLRAGRLDAAFVALPTASPGLELQELDRQPMVVALPSGHPLARRRRLSLADIAEAPMFWFERARQPAFYDHCERVFARHRFASRRVKEPGDHHVLLADVAAGHALALLPRSFMRLRRSGVVYRTLAEGDELAVGIGLALPLDRLSLRVLLAGAALAPSRPKA